MYRSDFSLFCFNRSLFAIKSSLFFLFLLTFIFSYGQEEEDVVDKILFPPSKGIWEKYMFHTFVAGHDSIIAYKPNGKRITLMIKDTFLVEGVGYGNYNQIKGDWVKLKREARSDYNKVEYYMPLIANNDLIDVSYVKWEKRKRQDRAFTLYHLIGLVLFCLPFIFIALFVRFKERQLLKTLSR